MNEIRIKDLLLERYNVRLLGLIHKVTGPVLGNRSPCSYTNNLTSRPPNNQDLQSRLKSKLQNAAAKMELDARGLFIGGRRRNRKKKKKHNNAAQAEKKKKKKAEKKAARAMKENNSPSVKPLDEVETEPLLDSKTEVPVEYIHDNTEQSAVSVAENKEDMPFGPFWTRTAGQEKDVKEAKRPVTLLDLAKQSEKDNKSRRQEEYDSAVEDNKPKEEPSRPAPLLYRQDQSKSQQNGISPTKAGAQTDATDGEPTFTNVNLDRCSVQSETTVTYTHKRAYNPFDSDDDEEEVYSANEAPSEVEQMGIDETITSQVKGLETTKRETSPLIDRSPKEKDVGGTCCWCAIM